MKKSILKGVIIGIVFFLTLEIAGHIMNRGDTDMTMEMSGATFPIVYMGIEGTIYNELHGYAKSMDLASLRDTITALEDNRNTEFTIKKYGEEITGVSYELRSVDGERLIENSQVLDYKEDKEKIVGKIALKDLIEENVEYSLVFKIEIEEQQTVNYYTRVIWSKDYHAKEKIAYVIEFNRKTFDKEEAKDLAKYLETNRTGDNTTFHKVNIHSSLTQVSWGGLEIKKETNPIVSLKELAKQTASLTVNYIVSTSDNNYVQYYQVEEFYRIRYTSDRIYLLDFERTMTRFFREKDNVFVNDKIVLGIADEDIPFVESEDGNNFVFLAQKKLCSYNVTENKLAVLFSFYGEENIDLRTIYNQHDMKILDIDEAGNVHFAVYGYLNRGRHEGEVGVEVYFYNSSLNTIEESVYIPYSKSFQLLKADMSKLLYISRESYLYLFLEEEVYEINLREKNYSSIIKTTQDGSLQVSSNNKMIAWQKGEDVYKCQEIILMNLNNRDKVTITSEADEYILPLGFMGEDLIYGFAKESDILVDSAGRTTFPMYKICICGVDGNILKKYTQENVFVLGCSIEKNQITLQRCQKQDNGEYQTIIADQIMNNQEVTVGANKVSTVGIDVYGKIVQITVKKEINAKGLKILTPKEVLFEGGRELNLASEVEEERYYVYGPEGVHGIFRKPADAINLAYEISGVVQNDKGQYVWIKGNRVTKNQIMAINGMAVTEEKDSVAICLDTVLKFEGVIRNSEYLLSQGKTIYSILESNVPDAQVLDLKGCNLDAILYYVNQDIPVLASLNDGSAVLVIGFNDYNIVIMDPKTGTVYKKGMNDSAKWFEENGNCFITYIK